MSLPHLRATWTRERLEHMQRTVRQVRERLRGRAPRPQIEDLEAIEALLGELNDRETEDDWDDDL